MTFAARIIFAFAIAITSAGFARAGDFRLRSAYSSSASWAGGASLDAALGFQNRASAFGGTRLMWNKSAGPFRFEIHSNLVFLQGSDVSYGGALLGFLPTPLPSTAFNLTQVWQSDANTYVTNTIDRLSVSYTSDSFVLRVGRQAITWGNGLVFQPGDILAPFSPGAVDTSYKTGADMVYGQYLFDSGADVQAVWVPRAATTGGAIAFDGSTFALRGSFDIGPLSSGIMLARDHGDTVGSLALSGALGGASWNAEVVDWSVGGTQTPSWLVNIANFGSLLGKNISYFAEVYHNGFGVTPGTALDSLPAALSKRIATGQVFYAGRDFLTFGGQMQLTPDLSVAPNAIFSLTDQSALASLTASYTISDSTSMVLHLTRPFGATGTDFGGRETTAGSGIYFGPSPAALLQLVHFF